MGGRRHFELDTRGIFANQKSKERWKNIEMPYVNHQLAITVWCLWKKSQLMLVEILSKNRSLARNNRPNHRKVNIVIWTNWFPLQWDCHVHLCVYHAQGLCVWLIPGSVSFQGEDDFRRRIAEVTTRDGLVVILFGQTGFGKSSYGNGIRTSIRQDRKVSNYFPVGINTHGSYTKAVSCWML